MALGDHNKKRYDFDFTVNEGDGPKTSFIRSIGYDEMYEIFMRVLWLPEGSTFRGTVLNDVKSSKEELSNEYRSTSSSEQMEAKKLSDSSS